MKPVSFILLTLVLASAGCNKQEYFVNPVDPEQVPLANVTPVIVKDTSTYQNDLDSSAVTPDDQTQFSAFVLLTRTTFDDGILPVTKVVSKVAFYDRRRPMQMGGKIFGYYGVDIRPALASPLTVNGLALFAVPHIVRVLGMPFAYGTEFRRELLMTRPWTDTLVSWRAKTDSVGTIDTSIQAPGTISVLAPAAGSILPRNQDLKLQWNATGNIVIFLSVMDPLTKRPRPLLMLVPGTNTGRARVPAKVLGALPPRDRLYLLTFVLANRKEHVAIGKYDALVQAASVYNCYIQFR